MSATFVQLVPSEPWSATEPCRDLSSFRHYYESRTGSCLVKVAAPHGAIHRFVTSGSDSQIFTPQYVVSPSKVLLSSCLFYLCTQLMT